MEKIFIDSGAHGIYNEAFKPGGIGYLYYKSQEFKDYVAAYCAFVLANKDKVLYPNVDAIFNPELTWEIQQYIEKTYGIRPMPVIHFGAPMEYVHRYLDAGYPYICVGGLGQTVTPGRYKQWADKVWKIICDTPDGTPRCKVHGFAVTSIPIMRRYPWYSVDSSSWLKMGAYGKVLIPKKKKGEWDYTANYNAVKVTFTPTAKNDTPHPDSTTLQIVKEYCQDINVPYGKSEIKQVEPEYILQPNEKRLSPTLVEKIIEIGIINDSNTRGTMNAIFYTRVVEQIPAYPWKYNHQTYKRKMLW